MKFITLAVYATILLETKCLSTVIPNFIPVGIPTNKTFAKTYKALDNKC